MTIFVGNLSLDVTEQELMRIFSSFGEVTSVRIMDDRYIGSGRKCKYGYVEMPCREAYEDAIETLDGKVLKQSQINVIQALPTSPVPNPTASKRTRQRPL